MRGAGVRPQDIGDGIDQSFLALDLAPWTQIYSDQWQSVTHFGRRLSTALTSGIEGANG